ncbi:hypothetical protein GU243_10565 [Pseudarthrobacter psychrotolerans]|uniref:Ribosomally synthesized peptide with SipW-like signal peptide n=1 Tax=Pseudarthrobacter psychrotolerans TaxID=2697569 RepID=A0A6P1NNU8_9MICC|nr:SipW-dependent-type signal peptide-containing protein [Pseudarthrobacter psychrotolerans]QHK20100.1 hypothetical protein GU243_10565 [Pseudarthrobacter psychrotolerans]
MRIPQTLRAALLIAAAVVLGLLTVQGTYALWNASTTAAPGTISSASFDVSLTASPSGQVTNMTLPGGGPATLALSPTASLQPGASVYAGVVVTNNSNAGGTFDTSISVGVPSKLPATPGTLADYLTVNAKTASAAADCNTVSGYSPLGAAGLTSTAVPKAGATVFCFQVSLSSTAPVSVKGQAVNISLPITARQVCGAPGGC